MARIKFQTKKKICAVTEVKYFERDCRQCGVVDASLIASSLKILDHQQSIVPPSNCPCVYVINRVHPYPLT